MNLKLSNKTLKLVAIDFLTQEHESFEYDFNDSDLDEYSRLRAQELMLAVEVLMDFYNE